MRDVCAIKIYETAICEQLKVQETRQSTVYFPPSTSKKVKLRQAAGCENFILSDWSYLAAEKFYFRSELKYSSSRATNIYHEIPDGACKRYKYHKHANIE